MRTAVVRRCRSAVIIAATIATALGVSLMAVASVLGATPLVNATIEPSQIAVGESAELTITSSGNTMQPVTLPVIPGLELRIVGQSRRIQIINGATLATTSLLVRVTAQTAGIFTITGITPQSQPLVLRVNAENAPGRLLNGPAVNGIRMTADGSAFVRLVLPKHEIYVGESIPVDIEVGMRTGFVTSLNGLPTLTGGEFTLNNLSHQPERSERLIDGKPFTLLTWHSIIAAVKPGTFSLSVESPLTVKIRTRAPRESMLDDLLGDPFLQNFFGATVPKDITVASPATELKVLALPTDGRPTDFSGAVGTFKISSDLSAPTAVAGDPLTLRMRVTGSGNFDRVDSPMLDRLDQWKTYPPKSTFKASDSLGYTGEKSFEQPLIAARPGTQTLPALTFSYFDPTARRYETARATPLNVSIAPSLADTSLHAPPPAAAAGSPAATPPPPPGTPANPTRPGLRPDHAATDAAASSLVPLYLRPAFLTMQSLLAAALASGWLALRGRAMRAGGIPRARGRAAAQAAHRALTEIEAAARSRNAKLFLNLSRALLQRTFAARWRMAPEHITAAEVDTRLGSDGADIHQLFALADEANYSGHELGVTDFERWTQIVRRRLTEPNPS